MQYINKNHPELSVVRQCHLLGLNRSGLYYQSAYPSSDPVTLMNEVRDLHERHPIYGYRKVHILLKRQGYHINIKRVHRLWRLMGCCALYAKKRTSESAKGRPKYPYLLKDLAITRLNQVWQTDITYIKLAGGYV